MNNQIIIFGCGVLGKTAYQYYKSCADILCFVDNKKDIWGTFYDGIEICSPEVLDRYDINEIGIVIAVKNGWEEIQKQLFLEYGILKSILFRIEERELDKSSDDVEEVFDIEKKEIIIHYAGGMGNQMFQYALARCFAKSGKNVTGDISEYGLFKGRKFELQRVFPNVIIEKCFYKRKMYYEDIEMCQHKELSVYQTDCLKADTEILKMERGIFKGYWQSYKYVEIVEKELRREFEFSNRCDIKLRNMAANIKNQNAVSVHIRRGDYLQTEELYGGICTDSYYGAAIRYFMQNKENIIFYFLSDDIKWVREKYTKLQNSVFIEKSMFEEYEDWYDMYIMSICKHNIIANSSFSWWGAWLNRYSDKLVIAPWEWVNGTDMPDICPVDWHRLDRDGRERGMHS